MSSSSTYLMLSFLSLLLGTGFSLLSADFYRTSCPQLSTIVKHKLTSAITKDSRMGASILRLHFHDCFVNGCDASVLLDDMPTFIGEKGATPNMNSLRGFEVIEDIKVAVEKACPGVVSCADILTMAARDSVNLLGGPTWKVKLGRRDSKTASKATANAVLPAPFLNLNEILRAFKDQGLSMKDMVALSGAHTIGRAKCAVFRPHIYNDTDIDVGFARHARKSCSSILGVDDNVTAPLDFQTEGKFDSRYFMNIINSKGLLHSTTLQAWTHC